jgi:hypothetical protein
MIMAIAMATVTDDVGTAWRRRQIMGLAMRPSGLTKTGTMMCLAFCRARRGKIQIKCRQKMQRRGRDQFHKLVFAILATLFPRPDRGSGFDVQPPGAVASVLLNSKVLDKAAELLRNDSLDNVTKRKDLYMALVGFLRVVGTHEATKQKVVYSERVVWPGDVNILALSFQGPGSSRCQAGSSLADGLQNLNIQSEVMLKGALGARKEFADQQGTDMLWLWRMISDLSSHLWIKMDDPRRGLTTHGIVEVAEEYNNGNNDAEDGSGRGNTCQACHV